MGRALGGDGAAVACLRRGLSLTMTAHAYAVLDAFVYGFAIQEAALPTPGDEMTEVVDDLADDHLAEYFPALHAFTVEHAMQPGCDFGDEFHFGLDLILDGLETAAKSV